MKNISRLALVALSLNLFGDQMKDFRFPNHLPWKLRAVRVGHGGVARPREALLVRSGSGGARGARLQCCGDQQASAPQCEDLAPAEPRAAHFVGPASGRPAAASFTTVARYFSSCSVA